ncbi:MAG TPA: DUF2207 domain-containing protein [Vicinamibacterales bacterium]|nr:DUF2207 domain-containing protein [Vicinamibacterales bacterium]
MPRRVAWLAVLLLLAAAPAAAERTLVIESFDARIAVAADGTIVVEETIRPRYTGSWNGLYRTIPVQYKSPQGLNYTLRLDVESVTDEAGRALRYESSHERHYRKLKIWVPGAVDATKTVKVRYRVTNGLRFFEEHDELYWNVTGDEWDVPIESVAADVRLPDGASGIRATAFRGAYGSTEQAGTSVEAGRVEVRTTRGLAFREGLTVVVGWNPGVVHRPTAVDKAADVVYGNLPLAIPPFVFAGMWWLWRARGRDPELAPIVTRYEPPGHLTPAELGTLVDGKPDMRDITATIVDLAVRGYLHIEETKNESLFGLLSNKDYRFSLKKPRESWAGLGAHERDLLAAMFGGTLESVELSDLKDKFYKHLPGLREDLYTMLVTRGFYTGRPDRVRVLYGAAGVMIGLAIAGAGAGTMAAWGMQPVAGIVAGILSGLIIVVFGWFMPSRTIRGTREVEHVLGFQEFLSRVEADRMERTIRTPEMFERYLPYAMALNVADTWAKAFEGIYHQSPSWYTGSEGAPAFRPTVFAGSLGRMSTQAASAMASATRSSGGSGFSGGSSGGGSGGGGGGGF